MEAMVDLFQDLALASQRSPQIYRGSGNWLRLNDKEFLTGLCRFGRKLITYILNLIETELSREKNKSNHVVTPVTLPFIALQMATFASYY